MYQKTYERCLLFAVSLCSRKIFRYSQKQQAQWNPIIQICSEFVDLHQHRQKIHLNLIQIFLAVGYSVKSKNWSSEGRLHFNLMDSTRQNLYRVPCISAR